MPELQQRYVETWNAFDPKARVSTERSIEGALDKAREIGRLQFAVQTLLTGSLHLVSGALSLLASEHHPAPPVIIPHHRVETS